MAYINLALTLKTSRAAQISAALGSGGQLLIYTGSPPANPDTAASGTLLGTLACSNPFGTSANGVLTASAITQANATASGTAGWARLQTAGGAGIADMDVGTSGTAIVLNTVNIVSGGPIQITSVTFTEV